MKYPSFRSYLKQVYYIIKYKLKNLGKFSTKDYDYDLFAPFREIAKDIKRMIKLKFRRVKK